MKLHKYPRKQASSISQSSANRPFQKTVPDASSSSYISPFLSFPGLQHSHSSVPSPSLHALAIGAPHAEQICERLLYLRVPDEGYDTPSGWAGGATSRWRAGLPVFVHCQSQWGLFGAESIPGGVRRKALGRAFGQCGVTYSTQGPFQLMYFITSTQPCKYSQELADNGYAPKATCYPFAHFTTLKCLTIISFQKQAQLSKQQSLPLQKYGNTAKYTPHCCFCLAMITFLLFKKTLSTAASFQQLPKVENTCTQQKTSLMGPMPTAIPSAPFQGLGWQLLGEAGRAGRAVPPCCQPAPFAGMSPSSSTEHSKLLFQASLHRLNRNAAICTRFSKQNASFYISNQAGRINFPLAMLSCWCVQKPNMQLL